MERLYCLALNHDQNYQAVLRMSCPCVWCRKFWLEACKFDVAQSIFVPHFRYMIQMFWNEYQSFIRILRIEFGAYLIRENKVVSLLCYCLYYEYSNPSAGWIIRWALEPCRHSKSRQHLIIYQFCTYSLYVLITTLS